MITVLVRTNIVG